MGILDFGIKVAPLCIPTRSKLSFKHIGEPEEQFTVAIS